MATQNPIEYEGTFPLPEAQLDRFLMRVHLGYPSNTDEVLMMDTHQVTSPIDTVGQVTNGDEIKSIQTAIKQIYVDPLIKQYIVSLVDSTRQHESVYLGASPRGSLALYRTSQARALLDGATSVIPDDVKGAGYTTWATASSLALRRASRASLHPISSSAASSVYPSPAPAPAADARNLRCSSSCVRGGTTSSVSVLP